LRDFDGSGGILTEKDRAHRRTPLATLSGTIFNGAGRDAELMTERKVLVITNVPALEEGA
jgi:hypothetical protein